MLVCVQSRQHCPKGATATAFQRHSERSSVPWDKPACKQFDMKSLWLKVFGFISLGAVPAYRASMPT